ncbi:MAG: twin transmembrane helix small protein [Proteobacteria bacterium]|nr:twin transmembrane helix small protein [Pseudomonadota bacterium]
MQIFVAILAGLAMLGVLGVLAAGLIGVARGGGDPERSNRLMRWRVMLQGAAILLIVLVLLMLHH